MSILVDLKKTLWTIESLKKISTAIWYYYSFWCKTYVCIRLYKTESKKYIFLTLNSTAKYLLTNKQYHTWLELIFPPRKRNKQENYVDARSLNMKNRKHNIIRHVQIKQCTTDDTDRVSSNNSFILHLWLVHAIAIDRVFKRNFFNENFRRIRDVN